MAVLGRQAILQAVDDGLIAITPFNADHVGPASVDLTLGSTFRVFRKVHEVIEVRDHTDYRECTDKLEIPEGGHILICLLYTSPSPRDLSTSRMPSSA